jgi:hypothetical protein
MTTIEERARAEILSTLAFHTKLDERFNTDGPSGYTDRSEPFIYSNSAEPPFEQRHYETGAWWLLKRRVNLDLAVNITAETVKRRMRQGESEDAAFHTAVWIFEWWLNAGEPPEETDSVDNFVRWMDDSEYELESSNP